MSDINPDSHTTPGFLFLRFLSSPIGDVAGCRAGTDDQRLRFGFLHLIEPSETSSRLLQSLKCDEPNVPEPLTVLQVIPRMRAGGAELGCLQIATALVKAGHRAIVASEGGQLVEPLTAAGAEHIIMPLASKNPLILAGNARRLAALIRHEGISIIHARSRAPAWSALVAARRTGIPFVTTYHSDYSEKGRLKNLYNSVMARSDTVIACLGLHGAPDPHTLPTPEERIAIIHRAFDDTVFDPAKLTPERIAAVRALLNADGTKPVLLLAGRITPRKAQHHLVTALGLLKERGAARCHLRAGRRNRKAGVQSRT